MTPRDRICVYAVKMRTTFHMHRNDVGARRNEIVHIPARLLDHQMHIQLGPGLVGKRPKRFHHEGAHCNVRHEPSIHHINMEPVDAGIQRFRA